GVSGFVIRSTSSQCECGERGESGCFLNEFKSRCGVFHARGVGHEIFPIGFGVMFRASSAKLPLGEKRVYIPWTALTSTCCRTQNSGTPSGRPGDIGVSGKCLRQTT